MPFLVSEDITTISFFKFMICSEFPWLSNLLWWSVLCAILVGVYFLTSYTLARMEKKKKKREKQSRAVLLQLHRLESINRQRYIRPICMFKEDQLHNAIGQPSLVSSILWLLVEFATTSTES